MGNFVNAPILVNATAGEFYKQPMYYALAHFRFTKRRISATIIFPIAVRLFLPIHDECSLPCNQYSVLCMSRQRLP